MTTAALIVQQHQHFIGFIQNLYFPLLPLQRLFPFVPAALFATESLSIGLQLKSAFYHYCIDHNAGKYSKIAP